MPARNDKRGGGERKKRAGGIACLVAAVLCALLVVRQMPRPMGGHPGGPQTPGTRGLILALSADSITLQARDLSAQTFALSAATRITMDRKPVAASELKSGQHARVISADGKNADEVRVRTRPWPVYPGGVYPGG